MPKLYPDLVVAATQLHVPVPETDSHYASGLFWQQAAMYQARSSCGNGWKLPEEHIRKLTASTDRKGGSVPCLKRNQERTVHGILCVCVCVRECVCVCAL